MMNLIVTRKLKNVHHARQFMGLANYFRRYVPGFAVLARPITMLTKKDQPWVWGEAQSQAFDEIKSILINQPVLSLFNPKYATQIHTDASKLGLGGILLQEQPDGGLKPVAYASRQTTPAEQKNHSFELETLAVVMSLAKFKVYVTGIKFTIVTDCNALRWTWSKRDLSPRIARWWLELKSGNLIGLVNDFVVQNGVLYRKVNGQLRVVVPRACRWS
jgi:hypothetical protein